MFAGSGLTEAPVKSVGASAVIVSVALGTTSVALSWTLGACPESVVSTVPTSTRLPEATVGWTA